MPLFAAIVRMGKLRAGGGERVLQRVLGAPRSRNQERDLYRIPLRLRPDRPSFDDRFQLRGNHTDLEESAQEGRLDFFFFFNPLPTRKRWRFSRRIGYFFDILLCCEILSFQF